MNTTIDFEYDPARHYEQLGTEFSKYHTNPLNVVFHFLTTPIGMIGAFSLLRSYTKSSSATMTLTALYLISLLPVLPSGDFLGTVFLCAVIVQCSRLVKLNLLKASALIIASYLLQDFAHFLSGEKTFQSSYSAGGQVR
jgi:uncharacterized membrane protein YGL010W